jgi:hypothetical protein
MVTAKRMKRPDIRAIALALELEQERDALAQRLAVAEAQRLALLHSLRSVLATIPDGWSNAETQAVRREARALVEEVGK